MKGRAVSAVQQRFHDLLIRQVGCIACRAHGVFNDYASIHHIDGRTKPDAHWLVLPLCGPHHQDDGSGTIAVHPWKGQFEAKYGRQRDLLRDCIAQLFAQGCAARVPEGALLAAGYEREAA